MFLFCFVLLLFSLIEPASSGLRISAGLEVSCLCVNWAINFVSQLSVVAVCLMATVFFTGNYDNMKFTWVCWKSGDSSPDLDDLGILNEVYPDGSNPTAPDGSKVGRFII